jgi:hypothetical protein
MSQHILEPLTPRYEVRIGWDRPLSNFFLIVHDNEIDEDNADPVIVWLGADRPASELDVDGVLVEAAKWALVPADLRARLLDEQRIEGRRSW